MRRSLSNSSYGELNKCMPLCNQVRSMISLRDEDSDDAEVKTLDSRAVDTDEIRKALVRVNISCTLCEPVQRLHHGGRLVDGAGSVNY